MISRYFKSEDRDFTLLRGDCVEQMRAFDFEFDMIFADPPYFLSNDGISVQSGKVVSVNKGEWDRSRGEKTDEAFTRMWIAEARKKLAPTGTIWISGTYHNIFSIAKILKEQHFKILNVVTWAKTNPPPNLSCRYFTHSSEFIIWARKFEKTPHYFDYKLMRRLNNGKQMRDVWNLPAIAPWEKHCGKHPTQKPLPLLTRIILASTRERAWILDPFAGSATSGIAANLLNRRFLGIELDEKFLSVAQERKREITNFNIFEDFRKKLKLPFQNFISPQTELVFKENLEQNLPF
ncbi:MAG: site-specific DNA-methyltransferase [Opitutales bacterium]|nr:site-specific DNA-methyltransferase [Opitutales bacterium]